MSISSEEPQLTKLISHICDYMGDMVAAKGDMASAMRHQIGLLRSYGVQYLVDETFGTNLFECFRLARTLPITADRVAYVREEIYQEKPIGPIAILVVETAIIYCLSTECLFITQMTFKSRDEVVLMMQRMKTAFDAAREQAADRMDSGTYQNLSYLAGSIINHLSRTALQLPSIVQFNYQANMPSLYLSNRIYQDASRSDELINENRTVHPLFMQRDIIGLAS